ncbi:histidine phosphatase family protein [Demequina sp. SO4-18]|uniref:histidine phosphatase family protein n=1 Tax=Demequina sp. SO4-18 TaxID=3401026 RepID=UPI003B5B0989
MSQLVLWRHARTDHNDEGRLQGSLDIPLDDDGRAQAAAAAARIVAHVGDHARVVSSPLSRASASADELSRLLGVETQVDEAFTQRPYGVWEGRTWDEVRERWPEDFERRHRGLEPRIDGWGASADVAARVGEGLRRWYDPETPTVVVSHGSAIQLGVLNLVGLDTESRVFGKIPHGAWHVLTLSDSGAWHVDAFALGAD